MSGIFRIFAVAKNKITTLKSKIIMTKTLSKLIDTCYNIKVLLAVSSYELHQYEDGSYVDFKVTKVTDPRSLLITAEQHQVRLFADGDYIIIRVFESI